MLVTRWGNLVFERNFVLAPQSPYVRAHIALFHFTFVAEDKRKSSYHSAVGDSHKPSKNQIKFVTRQKRAASKRTLHNLFSCGHFESPQQHQNRIWQFGLTDSSANEKGRKKKNANHRSTKPHCKKAKGKFKRDVAEDFDYSEKVFQAKFGDKHYTWSFGANHRDSGQRFKTWQETNWTNYSSDDFDTDSEPEVGKETRSSGSLADRSALGLPSTGPLRIQDVKKAFHSSALKWHPDLHQGPLRAAAGEKFKACLDAYKSLCAALSC